MEGSAGAIVAVSKIKAVELDFFSTLNCFSSFFTNGVIHSTISGNNIDPLSETDVIQTEIPENFVVIFEILLIDKE